MTHQAAQSEIQGVPHHHPSLPPPPDSPVVARDWWCDGSPCIWCLTGKLCNLSYLGWTDLFAPPFTTEINPWWLRLPTGLCSVWAAGLHLWHNVPTDTQKSLPGHLEMHLTEFTPNGYMTLSLTEGRREGGGRTMDGQDLNVSLSLTAGLFITSSSVMPVKILGSQL